MYKNLTEVTYSSKFNQIILRFESLSGVSRPLENLDLVKVLQLYPHDAKIMIDTYDSEVSKNAGINGQNM